MTKPKFPNFIPTIVGDKINPKYENMIFTCRDWCSRVCPSLDDEEHTCQRWQKKLKIIAGSMHKRCKICLDTEEKAKAYAAQKKTKISSITKPK